MVRASSTIPSEPVGLMRVSQVLQNLSQELQKAAKDPVFLGSANALRYRSSDADEEGVQANLLKAEKLYSMRRRWESVFGDDSDLLHDPALDILLYLYIATYRHAEVSVSSACYAAHVPQTTGLRYIAKLRDRKLVLRIDDPFDGRRHLLELTEAGEKLIHKCLEQV